MIKYYVINGCANFCCQSLLNRLLFKGFDDFDMANIHGRFFLERNPDFVTVTLGDFNNKTRVNVLWKIVTNKSVKANQMTNHFLRTKVPQGSNVNGHSTRNSRYLWPMRIERLKGLHPFPSGWTSVAHGCGSWSVSQGMGCGWLQQSFVNVGCVPFASGGDH